MALRVAIMANPQMQDVENLTSEFEKANPGIKVNYVTLPENESRAEITPRCQPRATSSTW